MKPFGKRHERRNRRERERRPAGRRSLSAGLGGAGAAGRRGIEATARRARVAQPGLARQGRRGLVLLRGLLALVFRTAALFERGLRSALAMLAAVLGALTGVLSRAITPERAVVGVIAVAVICLVVSQFSDYRGVEVGQAAYADVDAIAPPPQVDVEKAGEAHAYLLIPLGAVALALAVAALLSGRWQLGRLVALAGLVGVAVVLLVDLPRGLDEGSAGTGYAGAKATLSEGFYAELAAAAALVLCGLLLSLNLRRSGQPAGGRRRARRRRPRRRRAPSLARSGT